MGKINCWEWLKCGREPGGAKSIEIGVCPATTDTSYNGLNEGKNGGRICWAIAGTFCGCKLQGTLVDKMVSCMICDFMKLVKKEEEPAQFKVLKPGQDYKPHE
jgi:hypothetical protein